MNGLSGIQRIVAGFTVVALAWIPRAALAMDPAVRARTAAEYLMSTQQDNGLFRYEFDLIRARQSKKNNVVRQCGAGFALGQYFLHTGDARVGAALQRALAAYGQHSVATGRGRLVTLNGKLSKAKAGASALALLTELYYSGRSGDERFSSYRHAWRDGLLGLQNEEGGFARSPRVPTQSPYSNGEIWLALAYYHRRFPDDAKVSKALEKADRYFLSHYSATPHIGFFHWGLMAAAERYRGTGEARFARFGVDQVTHYLDRLRPGVNPRSNSCYAVEGLLSAMELAETVNAGSGLAGRLGERIRRELEKNAQLQIVPGQERVHFTGDRFLVSPDLRRMPGAFLNGRVVPRLRVDATQHCLSAFLRFSLMTDGRR